MKNLAVSFAVVFGLGAVIFAALSITLPTERDFIIALSSVFLGVLPYVHQQLEKRASRPGNVISPKGIVPLAGFTIQWPLMLAFGVAILFSVIEFTGLTFASVWNVLGVRMEREGTLNFALGTMIIFLFLPFLHTIMAYFVGHWIGTRCNKYAYLVSVAVVLISVVLVLFLVLVAFVLSGRSEDVVSAGPIGAIADLADAPSVSFLFAVVPPLVTILAGCRVGRSEQLSVYFDYLLRRLPGNSRDTIIAIVEEEAQHSRVKAEVSNSPGT